MLLIRLFSSVLLLFVLACEKEEAVQPSPSGAEPNPVRKEYVRATGQLGPGAGTLIIGLKPPVGGKLTEGAPLHVLARGQHLRFPKQVRTKLDTTRLPLRIPVTVADGALGPAEVDLGYYYCTDGTHASCRREETTLVVELDLTGEAPGGEAFFEHSPQLQRTN